MAATRRAGGSTAFGRERLRVQAAGHPSAWSSVTLEVLDDDLVGLLLGREWLGVEVRLGRDRSPLP
jgi:hypothetical protein